MAIVILSVAEGSPAARAGIRPGDQIDAVNGEPVLDEIDYQALTTESRLTVEIITAEGLHRTVKIRKDEWDPLGLTLDETILMKPKQCRNHCAFCFIDQMPCGMRDTLYVKDDDWRLSLMMGNYITLTNVSDEEFTRILKRQVSPLYISVHATDPVVRRNLMKNPQAGRLMERLEQLKAHGLQFHCQIVLCPGLNDGDILRKSIEDLRNLYPGALSMAIVPVGLTKYRDGLTELTRFNPETAGELIDLVETYQNRYVEEIGTRFVFPSDEFYCLSGRPLPPEEKYEDYPQLENGVGMLRLLEAECRDAAEELPKPAFLSRSLLIGTGVSAKPFIESLAARYMPAGTQVTVKAVPNTFFGDTITVTGLIVGRDLVNCLKGIDCDEILISQVMLRENSSCFLDDMTLEDVQKALGKPVRVVGNTGESLIRALYGLEEES